MGIRPLDAYAAVIAGVCSVSYLYFGFYLLPPSSRDPRFKPLLLACFSWSAWSLSYLLYFLSRGDAARDLYLRFAYAGMLSFVLLLEFVLRYTRRIQKERTARRIFAATWLPPLLGAGASLAANAVARGFPSGFWFLYAEIQTFLYNAASVAFMLLYYLRHKTRRSRAQVYALCGSAAVLMVLSWAADYHFALRNSLNIIPAWVLVWIGVLLYLIRKHGFLPAIPDLINRDITENIEEGILLLDPDLKTIFQNGAARRFLNAREGGSADLLSAVSERRVLGESLRKLAETGSTRLKIRVTLIPSGGVPLPMELTIKKVIDSDGNPSGYLAILSMVKNAQSLKETYGITRREMEVLLQLASGATNREMADLLDISEKTIETHVGSIYGKMMVRNRVELLQLLSGADSLRPVPAGPPDARKGLLIRRPE